MTRGNSRRLAATAAMAVAGVGVSAYLTLVHYDNSVLVCGVGDCQTVQSSRYSEIAGIPIAILGLGMYLALLGLTIARWRRPGLAETLVVATFGIALAGVIYSAYLTYLEIAVIKAICQWCVISALLTLGIFAVEAANLRRVMATPEIDEGAA